MKECGVSVDKESITQFFNCMSGKEVTATIADGKKKLITMPTGGARAAAGPVAKGAAAAQVVEEVKKEEVEEVDMGGLFGGDDEY